MNHAAQVLRRALAKKEIRQFLNDHHVTLYLQPGRALLDQCGITVFDVIDVKKFGAENCAAVVLNGMSFSLSETWFGADFVPEPFVLHRGLRPAQATPQSYFLVGRSCLESDIIRWRAISSPAAIERGDLVVIANTAGYQMDSNESSFHQIPLPTKVSATLRNSCWQLALDDRFSTEERTMIVSSLLETIGNTPLLRIPLRQGEVDLFLKLEMFNPTGSMKDRMALNMVRKLGLLDARRPGAGIVESSSGNTATALAMICADRGLRFTAIMDNHASQDKIRSVSALGGLVKIVGGGDGNLATALRDAEAERMNRKNIDTYWTEQHNNDANADGYFALARELIEDLGGNISHFVSAIGTGGSLCGTARCLRLLQPNVQVIGVEPEGSIIFGGEGREYCQSGTGTPKGATVGLVIDYDIIDAGCKVGDAEAFSACRYMAKAFGLLVGGSTGGALFVAFDVARSAPEGSRIVVLACDAGTKYLDTIFSDEWLATKGIDLVNIEGSFSDVLPVNGRNLCSFQCLGCSTLECETRKSSC